MDKKNVHTITYQHQNIEKVNAELYEVIKTYLENKKYPATKQQKREVVLKIVEVFNH